MVFHHQKALDPCTNLKCLRLGLLKSVQIYSYAGCWFTQKMHTQCCTVLVTHPVILIE